MRGSPRWPENPLLMRELDLLPPDLAKLSIDEKEIVLPMEKALLAIDVLEKQGIRIVGWEGWVKDQDGRIGHGNASQGTVSLDDLSVSQAADVCRRTIREDWKRWQRDNSQSSNQLYFCITCAA